MEAHDMTAQTNTDCGPRWLHRNRNLDINEDLFCQEFLAEYPMRYHGGCFYTVDGLVTDESRLRERIFEKLRPHIDRYHTARTETLMRALRLMASHELPPLQEDRVHIASGTILVENGRLLEEKEFCRNRLAVELLRREPGDWDLPEPEGDRYDPLTGGRMNWGQELQWEDCPRWKRFLGELLEPEDVQTLREYLGYCLIPTTRAQRMLMIVGRGGEGKSVIGHVMHGIFGESMVQSSITKIECNRFARADLEGKLLMVDDDMDLNELEKTSCLKTIITAQSPMDIERKGIQSYQAQLYSRFLCFGNGALAAANDTSDGFFRRQIILLAKPKAPGRRDDPHLVEALTAESGGILLWMLQGLHQLQSRGYRFTESAQAAQNLLQQRQGNGVLEDFLQSQGYIEFSPGAGASTKQLYQTYRQWCTDNSEKEMGQKRFANELSQVGRRYGLTATASIRLNNGRYCRGYLGVALKA